jgi:hypothetical protein
MQKLRKHVRCVHPTLKVNFTRGQSFGPQPDVVPADLEISRPVVFDSQVQRRPHCGPKSQQKQEAAAGRSAPGVSRPAASAGTIDWEIQKGSAATLSLAKFL